MAGAAGAHMVVARHPAVLLLLAAVPAPLVHLGAVEAELFGEHNHAIRVKSGVLLVLALKNDLLFLVEVATAQTFAGSGHRRSVLAAVDLERV